MKRITYSFLALATFLAGCSAQLPFLPTPEVPRSTIEASVNDLLKESTVSTLTLERQTVQWAAEHYSKDFINQGSYRIVWVAHAVGTLQGVWPPGPGTPKLPKRFSSLTMLIAPDDGTVLAATAAPLPD